MDRALSLLGVRQMLEAEDVNDAVVAVEHNGSDHYTGFYRGKVRMPAQLRRWLEKVSTKDGLDDGELERGATSIADGSCAGGPPVHRIVATVQQEEGLCIRVRGGLGSVRLVKPGGSAEVVGYLPSHPNDQHQNYVGDPTCVLPLAVAEGVLDVLQLPQGAATDSIYEGLAFTVCQPAVPFVRAIWFTPETADYVCGREKGRHERAAQTMYGLWHEHSKGKMTCDASQPAAGSYTEMGVGVLPGVGRRSLSIDGVSTNVPFPRNAALSDLIEPNLGDFMSDVSAVVHHVLSSANAHPVALHVRQHGRVARAYQYPRLRSDARCLSSHQVVIRGPRFNPAEGHNHDFETFLSVSDLHTDTWDGGGEMGSCTVHTCRRVEDTVSHVGDAADERLRLRLRGLACFPTPEGGRGVHIASMVPGWHCAILMQTAKRLHGSVVACESVPRGSPLAYSRTSGRVTDAASGLSVQSTALTARADPLLTGGCSLPSMQMMRVVTYPLKRIETLLERLARDPCKEEDLLNASHPWIVQRAGLTD